MPKFYFSLFESPNVDFFCQLSCLEDLIDWLCLIALSVFVVLYRFVVLVNWKRCSSVFEGMLMDFLLILFGDVKAQQWQGFHSLIIEFISRPRITKQESTSGSELGVSISWQSKRKHLMGWSKVQWDGIKHTIYPILPQRYSPVFKGGGRNAFVNQLGISANQCVEKTCQKTSEQKFERSIFIYFSMCAC